MTRRTALTALAALSASAQEKRLTANDVIERIKKNIGVPWKTPTVDTFKAGNPDTAVSGIAVTMMATLDVLERAAAANRNLVITHEPTFYNHLDNTADLAKQDDAVLAGKQAFIQQHNLVVWRFHDHWHARRPDGILAGMTHALGWEKFQNAANQALFTLPRTTLNNLAESVKQKLNIRVVRVVGDPQLEITQVGFLPGAAGSPRQIRLLERDDVQALLIGETPEWETVEYVADAVTEHKPKALIILGHIPSEQAGMEECTRWLKTFINEVPVEFIPAREPFWLPKS
ncbi:MAG TPA: Nif3-like dinuclear metal center hexameric protein [Bryobacteraceae bacterium]|nr:Nif3-like dinuclear metal center hexameric protein [Bryobacteraceae bacterium]